MNRERRPGEGKPEEQKPLKIIRDRFQDLHPNYEKSWLEKSVDEKLPQGKVNPESLKAFREHLASAPQFVLSEQLADLVALLRRREDLQKEPALSDLKESLVREALRRSVQRASMNLKDAHRKALENFVTETAGLELNEPTVVEWMTELFGNKASQAADLAAYAHQCVRTSLTPHARSSLFSKLVTPMISRAQDKNVLFNNAYKKLLEREKEEKE